MEKTLRRARGRPKSTANDEPTITVQALDRGLNLLSVLAKESRASLTDLSLRIGMPPSSAYRLLSTLQKHGFAEFDDATQDWMIGVEAFRIGSAFTQRTNLVEISREPMQELMESTGETANLAISSGGHVVFVSQVETPHPIRAFFPPGARSPMHASGIGKALLAEMSRPDIERLLHTHGLEEFTDRTLTAPDGLFSDLELTRARGWSFDNEERYAGMCCVAAPIYNMFGEAIAGVSVSGPTMRFPLHSVAEIGPKVRHAAETISGLVGGAKKS